MIFNDNEKVTIVHGAISGIHNEDIKIYYNPNMIMFAGQPGPDRIELLKNPLVVT